MELCSIRAINKDDVPFLWDMLYEIRFARSVREGKVQPSRDILKTPELAKYVQDWGRTGDTDLLLPVQIINHLLEQHGIVFLKKMIKDMDM